MRSIFYMEGDTLSGSNSLQISTSLFTCGGFPLTPPHLYVKFCQKVSKIRVCVARQWNTHGWIGLTLNVSKIKFFLILDQYFIVMFSFKNWVYFICVFKKWHISLLFVSNRYFENNYSLMILRVYKSIWSFKELKKTFKVTFHGNKKTFTPWIC